MKKTYLCLAALTLAASVSAQAPNGTYQMNVTLGTDVPIVAKIVVNLTADERGFISGTGAATVGAETVELKATGRYSPQNRRETNACILTLKGRSFLWLGRGAVADDAIVFTWRCRRGREHASGSELLALPRQSALWQSPGRLVLAAPSSAAFLPMIGTLEFAAQDAQLARAAQAITVALNGNDMSDRARLTETATIVLDSFPLADGRNELTIAALDARGLTLNGQFVLWAGGQRLVTTVTDEAGAPVAGAIVQATVGDSHAPVLTAGTNEAGEAALTGLPDRTLAVEVFGSGNRYGCTAVAGSAATATVVLQGFAAPSAVANNNFNDGTAAGWETGTATVTMVSHEESTIGVPAAPAEPPADWDMLAGTSDPQTPARVSRTFVTAPGTTSVTLRYRLAAAGFPEWPAVRDRPCVVAALRTQSGESIVTEAVIATDETLGTGQLTAWREIGLPVSPGGDVVQADLMLATMEPLPFPLYLLVDRIAESPVELAVQRAECVLLDSNRFEVTLGNEPPGWVYAIDIRHEDGPDPSWRPLGDTQVVENYVHRVAGRFKVRARVTLFDGRQCVSFEKSVIVKFPSATEMLGNADCAAAFEAAWTETKAACTPGSRREQGFFVQLSTQPGAEGYRFGPTITGPLARPWEGASIQWWMMMAVPPDELPAEWTPDAGAIYTVCFFHTHTPMRYARSGRDAGPSGSDATFGNAHGLPMLVYDYIGEPYDFAGTTRYEVPKGHPLDAPAKVYTAGPERRSQP